MIHQSGLSLPQPEAIKGSFSIDPAVFKDDDGNYYMYFGGIWGGQLQRWRTGHLIAEDESPFVHLPKTMNLLYVPKLHGLQMICWNLLKHVKDVIIVDENGNPLLQVIMTDDFLKHRWMHKYNGKYYFSYSTGDTHFICYAIGDNPYGPFTYTGRILNPVVGWTSHHSIVEFKGKWYLFYHDCSLSKGSNTFAIVKVTELNS